ncbi:MAG TPA: tRNA (adenosine(37)-N6)-threonylcarbamoyltransferase complex ATPase subunit type 1 TsaE [Deltaproteobacteria bacterium]|nr:tRNA (adenosine(37)-N6)-threonylcarbamoyltransferase complex ATPase subunit type 1 TsaE [Deltaproteobacteria bacterium]
MRALLLSSPAETHELGRRLGVALPPGACLALSGDLGAGKTALVRGIAEGLGVPSLIQSPTFVLVQIHEGGRLPLWHADLYRLGDASELDELGLDAMAPETVLAIEWASRFPELLPADRLEIRLEDAPRGRRAELSATGARHAALEGLDV